MALDAGFERAAGIGNEPGIGGMLGGLVNRQDWWRHKSYYERGIFSEAAADVFGYDSFRSSYHFGKGIFGGAQTEAMVMGEQAKWINAGRPAVNQAYRRFMDPYMDALSTKNMFREAGAQFKIAGNTASRAEAMAASKLGGNLAMMGVFKSGMQLLGPAIAIYSMADIVQDAKQGYREGGVTGGVGAGIKSAGSWVLQQAAINLVTRNPYAAAAAGVLLGTVGGSYLAYKGAQAIANYGGEIRRYSPWQGNMQAFSSRTAFSMRQQSAMLMGETGLAPRGYLGNEAMRMHL